MSAAAGFSAEAERQFIPGTIHLLDLQGQMNVQHAAGYKDVVLVPAPSNNPDDPLNWPPRRKYLAAFCMALYVLVVGICSSMLYSTLATLSKTSGLSVDNLNAGTGYMFLTYGWGCVPLQALALQYGKRPIYLVSLLGTVGVMVWQPFITRNGEWIAAKLLQGIFGAPMESLAEISVSDVFFTHERGLYMAIYAMALAYSNNLAPLMMGFINDGQGLEWTFYWCAIFCAFAFVFCFFFMEESNFPRSNITGQEEACQDIDPSHCTKHDSLTETDCECKKTNSYQANEDMSSGEIQQTKKTYLDRIKPITLDGFRKKNQMWDLMIRPVKFLRFPVVFYAGFSYGATLVWLAMMNATESVVLSNAPYNFSTSIIGVSFVSPLIGSTLAALYTGYFGDWLALRLARRNKGVLEAEHRLWLYMAALLGLPLGFLLWGIGATQNTMWFGPVFSMGVVSFITTSGSQIFITYLIDSYRDLGGEALVSVIVVRNTMGFAFGYGVTPWVENMGLQNSFITATCVAVAHTLSILLLIKYGKMLRKRSRHQYWNYLQQAISKGLAN